MKRILLTFAAAVAGFAAHSQVIFSVEAPSDITGSYELTYATSTDWGVADLLDPANAVIDTLMFAEDGTPGTNAQGNPISQEGCNPLTNDLTGKIALIYRNTCEFGTKAFNAQNAGAVAVVIINRDDEVIAMGGGLDGINVTIPVVMVSSSTGLLIKQKMDLGEDVVAFIGNKSGYYANDLGSDKSKILIPRQLAIPAALAQTGSEFNFELGVWVHNYGQNDLTGITVNATVGKEGTDLYDETSAPFDLLSGDSTFIAFATPFEQATYAAGEYVLTYTLIPSAITDDYAADNTVETRFHLTENMFALGRLDENGLPEIDGGTRPSTAGIPFFSTCIVFRNENANRLGARGMWFSASKNAADGTMEGEEIIVSAEKWDNQFNTLTDLFPGGTTDQASLNAAFSNLTEITSGTYVYDADLVDTMIYVEFAQPFALENNQRYLFCATTASENVFIGYERQTKYDLVEANDDQPTQAIKVGTDFSFGFQGGDVPANAIKTFPIAELGLVDEELASSSFPNPAKNNVTVKVAGFTGNANLTVTDMAGRVVLTDDVTVANDGTFGVNTTSLNNGMYIFKMITAEGGKATFNVVISK